MTTDQIKWVSALRGWLMFIGILTHIAALLALIVWLAVIV
jgi:hypothetical protein